MHMHKQAQKVYHIGKKENHYILLMHIFKKMGKC